MKGLYAIGDVAGPPMLAHKGEREGVVVAEVIAGQHPHLFDYTNVPGATYCHPEVASVGLTEQQCKDKKLDYKVGRFNFSANGRARTSGETEGFVKIIRGAKYGEILGAHIVGSHATELIHELIVARTNEYTVEEVDLAIHAHPTLSEAIAEASARLARQDDPRVGCPSCWSATSARWRTRRRSSLQRAVAKARISGELDEDLLLLVEHPPVVTLGRSFKERHLLASPALLASRGRRAVRGRAGRRRHLPRARTARRVSDRRPQAPQARSPLVSAAGGGSAHPRASRRSASRASAARDSPACGREGRKLASIGVHARDWVTWHGFALNVTTDLRYFDLIVPCGIDMVEMSSIGRELERRGDAAANSDALLATVKANVAAAFGDVFTLDVAAMEPQALLRAAAPIVAA